MGVLDVETSPVVLEAPDEVDTRRVTLFVLGGTDYTIPAKPRINVALKYLRVARKEGEAIAAAGLLEDLLGAEGFEALTDWDDLTPEQFEAVIEAAVKHTLGALEAVKGNAGRGPRK